MMCSTTSSGEVFNQVGGALRYGNADEEIPFPGACMRPILAEDYGWRIRGGEEEGLRKSVYDYVSSFDLVVTAVYCYATSCDKESDRSLGYNYKNIIPIYLH